MTITVDRPAGAQVGTLACDCRTRDASVPRAHTHAVGMTDPAGINTLIELHAVFTHAGRTWSVYVRQWAGWTTAGRALAQAFVDTHGAAWYASGLPIEREEITESN